MNALGNSKRRILSAAEDAAVRRYAARYYEKYKENLKGCCKLFMLIATLQALEDDYGWSQKECRAFVKHFEKRLDELNAFLESNTYSAGVSEYQQFDTDYNQEKLKELAEYYGVKYDENFFVF